MASEQEGKGPDETIETLKSSPQTEPVGQTELREAKLTTTLAELREKGITGAEMAAICGITKDGQVEELQKDTAVTQVTIKTNDPGKSLMEIIRFIKSEKGTRIPTAPSRNGELNIQAAFPNLNQALRFREHMQTIDEDAKVSISANPGHICTHGDTVMALGAAFTLAKQGRPGSINVNGRTDSPTGERQSDARIRKTEFPHSRAGEKAREHAERLADLTEQRELPTQIEVIRIRIPASLRFDEKSARVLRGILDTVKSRRTGMSRVVVNGNIMTIFTGGERGPGHNLKRAGKLKPATLKKFKFTMVVDHVSDVEAHRTASGEWVYQGDFEETFPDAYGLFETERFGATYEDDQRNASVATRELGETVNGFLEITDVTSKDYEIGVAENEITVGRTVENARIKARLEKILGDKPKSGVTAVLSNAGGGKTHLAKDIMMMCKTLRIKHNYVRASEEDTTIPFAYIRRLGRKYLEDLPPEVRTDFEVFEHFVNQTKEEKLNAQVRGELATMRNNEGAIAAEMDRLKKAVAAESPTVTQVDDLHWADEPSIGILATMIAREKYESRRDPTRHHLVVLSRKEEVVAGGTSTGLPAAIKTAISDHPNSDTLELHLIQNTEDTHDKTGEFIAAKLSKALGISVTQSDIPPTFAQQVFKLYENHPLSTEQLVRLLADLKLIRSENESVIFPSKETVEKMKAKIKTMDTIMQGRFGEVSKNGKTVFDLLITLGEPVEEKVLFALLEANGISETEAKLQLADLKGRELITKTKTGDDDESVTYKPAHPIIAESRKSQLVDMGDEAKLAHIYANGLGNAPRDIRRLAPSTLSFNLLLKAVGREDIEEKEMLKELVIMLDVAIQAARKELQSNNNLAAVAIAEKTLAAIRPLEEAIKLDQDKQKMAKKKHPIMAMLAEGYRRTGMPEKAQSILREIEKMHRSVPEAAILEGPEMLKHLALEAELTFSTAKGGEHGAAQLQAPIANLATAIAIEKVKTPDSPEISIAEGTLKLSRLREIGKRAEDPTTAEQAKIDFKTQKDECEKLLKTLDALAPTNPGAEKIALVLKRQIYVTTYLVLCKKAQGIDEESIYMKKITEDLVEEMETLRENLEKTTAGWSKNLALLAEAPARVAFNFMMLGRVEHLAGNHSKAKEVLEAGLRLASRVYSTTAIAVLNQVSGDILTFGNLGRNGTQFQHWNEHELEEAFHRYESGQIELRRQEQPIEQNGYGQPLIINQTITLAALIETKRAKKTLDSLQEDKEKLKERVTTQWGRITRTLVELSKDYAPDKPPEAKHNNDFLKETGTLGLLLKAAKSLGMDTKTLTIPPELPIHSFNKQKKQVDARIKKGNLSESDANLLFFRKIGSDALIELLAA